MKGWWILLILAALASLGIAVEILESTLEISFSFPTPENNSYNPSAITINYTALGDSLQSTFLDFNKTLVLWLRMNNESDEIYPSVKDSSGHGNNGTALNGANLSLGKMGSAYIFNGNDEYINVTDRQEFSPTFDGLTVSVWIKPATFEFAANDISTKDALHFLSKAQPYANEWYFRIYNASTSNRPKRISFNAFNLTGGIGAGSYFQDNLTENQWIHIVGVINMTSISIYKNGMLRDMDYHSLNLQDGAAPIRVGRTGPNDTNKSSFNGSIDEIMVFSRALSPEEIIGLYNATRLLIPFNNLSNGTYTIKAFALDSDGNMNSTEERMLIVGNALIFPASILNSPLDDAVLANNAIAFICNFTGNSLSNISLYTNTNGSWSVNAVKEITGSSGQTYFTINDVADGTYIWNCLVKDGNNNQAFSQANNTIIVDTIAPMIIISAPDNGYSSTDNVINFNFSATDNIDENITCNITIDGNVEVNSFIWNGTFKAAAINANVGSHQWNITCYDDALNFNTSLTRAFTITQAVSNTESSGGGGGGNFSIVPEQPLIPESQIIEATISDGQTPFTGASLEVKNITNATLIVFAIAQLPNGMAPLKKIIYKIVEAKMDLPDDVTSIIIKFKIENSWLQANNVSTDDIALYRFNSGWNALPTILVSKDNEYSYYEAETPGFSYFAIASKSDAPGNTAIAPALEVTGSVVDNIRLNGFGNKKEYAKTALLIFGIFATIISGKLFAGLMKKKILDSGY